MADTIDPRTGRPLGDHGTAAQAIDFALEHVDGPGEGEDFLRAWREGSLDEWPEFYEWLRAQEVEALGFVDRATTPVGQMRRSIHRSHRGEGHNFVD